MGQLALTDSGGASKTSSLDRLKLVASRLLKRTPKPSSMASAAVAPSSPPPSQQAAGAQRDYATRGGKAAARSLARLSATSMVSVDEEDASSAAAAENETVAANAVPFSRKSRNEVNENAAAKPSTPADVAAGRILPRPAAGPGAQVRPLRQGPGIRGLRRRPPGDKQAHGEDRGGQDNPEGEEDRSVEAEAKSALRLVSEEILNEKERKLSSRAGPLLRFCLRRSSLRKAANVFFLSEQAEREERERENKRERVKREEA